MNLETIKKIDSIYQEIIEERKKSDLSDEEFSLSENIKNKAFEIIKIYKENWISTSYNNLTNRNDHALVKILNYNWFFNKSLKKEFREELKTFKIYL